MTVSRQLALVKAKVLEVITLKRVRTENKDKKLKCENEEHGRRKRSDKRHTRKLLPGSAHAQTPVVLCLVLEVHLTDPGEGIGATPVVTLLPPIW
jgi:hypothetical protein